MSKFKDILPRSLFGRSLMIIVTPTVLLQLILMVVFLDNHWKKMTMRYSESIAGEIALIVEDYKVHRQTSITPRSLERYLGMEIALSKKKLEKNTDRLAYGGLWEKWTVEFLDSAIGENISDPYRIAYDSGNNYVDVYIGIGENTMSIKFSDRRIFTSSSYIFLLWMVSSSIVLSFISIWFMRNQVRPIRKLAVAADRFGRGLDAGSFKPSGAREVRQASHAFLVMKNRIQRQIDQRTTMLAGISHDLRTPLTRLKLGLSIIDTDDAKDMKRDIDDMDRMIGGYLEFVRGDGDEEVEDVSINELVDHTVKAYRDEINRVNVDFLENDVVISSRPLSLERCIGNLLKNALKYADNVEINIEAEDSYIFIHVDDDGEGVPEESYDEVFKAFYRMDKARNSKTGGVGLGLTISKDIALSHGGDVVLSTSKMGGLRATVRLPL